MNRTTEDEFSDGKFEAAATPDSVISHKRDSLLQRKPTLPSQKAAEDAAARQITVLANTPGIYLIRCLVTGALYVGYAKCLRRRLFGHFSKLGRGSGETELMQADWNRYGPEGFDARFLHCPAEDRWWLETQLILFLRCREEQGGYNRMVAGRWCLTARIRNIEWKYQRSGKFKLREGLKRDLRMGETYARTFMRDLTLLSDEVEQIMADLVRPHLQQQLPAILAQLQTLPPAELRRSRREKKPEKKWPITHPTKRATTGGREHSVAVGVR